VRKTGLGWAGWNHLQRAQAVAAFFYLAKESEGWTQDRLIPLLVGLAELVPWLKQWHNEVDPEFGRLGDYYETLVQEEARNLGYAGGDLSLWRPQVRAPGRRKSS
jgi:hypothetical protein